MGRLVYCAIHWSRIKCARNCARDRIGGRRGANVVAVVLSRRQAPRSRIQCFSLECMCVCERPTLSIKSGRVASTLDGMSPVLRVAARMSLHKQGKTCVRAYVCVGVGVCYFATHIAHFIARPLETCTSRYSVKRALSKKNC